MPKKLAAGNWKMNGLRQALDEVRALHDACPDARCDIVICPPATLIGPMVEVSNDKQIEVGGQDCHANTSGAHTGDISAPMLADSGASYVILGHSERRASYGETDAQVRAKTTSAWNANLTAIVCIGETLEQWEAGQTLDVVGRQLQGSTPDGATSETLVIAYEPVWAIGTGKTPTLEEIGAVHGFIRDALVRRFGEEGQAMRIVYGGSMNPKNARDIAGIPNVDGGLVGGASLKASDFCHIVKALNA